jgi:hypothetical protein
MTKTIILFTAILTAVIILASCGGKDDGKSNECEIVTFTVDGVEWSIAADGTITPPTAYPKGSNVSSLVPVIDIRGAKVEPPSGEAQDFSRFVDYTVTAEDGKTAKTYRARAVVSTD